VIGALYDRFGKPIKGGNNLVIDTVHDDSPQIPLRMGPMVLVGTVLTHLFGGSAGREGTAVQMGASLADLIAHRFGVRKETRRQILAAGIAGGFGSVFGTPIAGTIFGLEVVHVGRMEYDALFPPTRARRRSRSRRSCSPSGPPSRSPWRSPASPSSS
jgi:H+/Cl- antiporter ClcA